MSSNEPGRRGRHGFLENDLFHTVVDPQAASNRATSTAQHTLGPARTSEHGYRVNVQSARPQTAAQDGERLGRLSGDTPARVPAGQARYSTVATAPSTPLPYNIITWDSRAPQRQHSPSGDEIPRSESLRAVHDRLSGRSSTSLVSPPPERAAVANPESAPPLASGPGASSVSAFPADAQAGAAQASDYFPLGARESSDRDPRVRTNSATAPDKTRPPYPPVTASRASRFQEGPGSDLDDDQHSTGDHESKATTTRIYVPLDSGIADAKAIDDRYIYTGRTSPATWGGLQSMKPTAPFAAALEKPLSAKLRPAYNVTSTSISVPNAVRTAASQIPVAVSRTSNRDPQTLHTSQTKETHRGQHDAQRHGRHGTPFAPTTAAHTRTPAQQAETAGSPGAAAHRPVLSLDGRSSYNPGQRAGHPIPLPVGLATAAGTNPRYPSHIAPLVPSQFPHVASSSLGHTTTASVSYTPNSGTITNPAYMRGAHAPSYHAASGSVPTVARTSLSQIPSGSSARRPHKNTITSYQCRHCEHPPFIILNHAKCHVEGHYDPFYRDQTFVMEQHIKVIHELVDD